MAKIVMPKNSALLEEVEAVLKIYDDLEGWTAYHEFLDEITEDTVVNVRAQAFLYGEGETVKATPEEVAYMMMREQRDPDFLSGHCDCIGESDFNVNWCPDKLFGQGFVQL